MLFSASAPAITGLSESVKALAVKVSRQHRGTYTDSPTPAFLGQNPGRSPDTRGGLWTTRQLEEIQTRGASASIGFDYLPNPAPVSPASGPALPWESTASGSSATINTGNGNKLTQIPLFSWKQRGGLPIEFELYQNSQGGSAGGAGYGWTSTFDTFVNTSGSYPIVQWDNGLNVPYTVSGSTYTPPAGIYDALVKNTGGTWTLTKKDGTVYNFNSSGYLTSVADRNANTLSLTYTSSHIISTITDSTGRTVTIGSTGTVINSVTDPMSHQWTFTQNGSGDLTKISWPVLSASTYTDQFAYTSHCITSHTDRWGQVWAATYNSSNMLTSETDPLSHVTRYTYTVVSATVTDPLSHTVVDNYSSGVVASHVDESGYSTSYTARDSNYNPTSITDGRGHVWAATYDTKGNVLTSTDPLSHVKTFTYNGFAEPLTSEDALSNTTTNTYDTYGNLLTVTDPLSHVTTNTYDSYGQLLTTEDANSHTTTLTYDSNGNLSTIETPLTHTTTLGYDGMGRLTSVTDPLTHIESTSYDVWGRKSVVTHADSSTISYSYLPTDQLLSVTDEDSHTTNYAYDNAERLSSVTNPRSDAESYGYDNANHRTSVTNGRGYTRNYVVSNRGEITKLTMPDGIVTQWTYDGDGNTTSYEDGIGNTTNYVFDNANRETAVNYPSGTDTGFTYDNADRKTGMTDATGTTTWTFDNADRLTGLSTPQGTTAYGYDNGNRKTSLTENGTLLTSYVLDNDGNRTSLTNSDSETTTWVYDAARRVTSQTVASGEVSTFGYDNRNRETSVSHKNSSGTVLESESYVVDSAGNLTSKTVGATTTSYTFDAADQILTESNGGTYSASYTYDANGNRTSKTLGGVTDTYTVDDGDKLTSTSTKSYTYDGDGRTATVVSGAGTTTLSYDYESRLTSIANPGGSTYTYSYNGLDTRVGKNEGTSQTYRRDGVDVTSPVLSDGISHFTPGVSQHTTATTFNHSDQLGSFVAQTNSSQSVTATQQFDSFGMLVTSTGTAAGPFGFVGKSGYQTDASGLQLLGHRYYDPSTGRFLTRDTAQDGRNWYGYVQNNPLKRIDPTGHLPWWVRAIVKIAVHIGSWGGDGDQEPDPIHITGKKPPIVGPAPPPAGDGPSGQNDWQDDAKVALVLVCVIAFIVVTDGTGAVVLAAA